MDCTVAECTEGAVRLVGGMNETKGNKVELCHGGGWYGLCDRYSSYKEAHVVCKQLGYPYSGTLMIVFKSIEESTSVYMYGFTLTYNTFFIKSCLGARIISNGDDNEMISIFQCTGNK